MTLEEIKIFLSKYQPETYPNQVQKKPTVSVLVQTYQHVKYIKDCLDGILRQETDFDFEILIGEDDSNDGTREICIEYAQRFPDKIRLFLHDRNKKIKDKKFKPGQFNLFNNLFSARGKYIAVCEGDDYWTDAFKLQKQVQFLENNEDCMIVCGGFISMGPKTNQTHIRNSPTSNDKKDEKGFFFDLEDHLTSWTVKTLTAVTRNKPEVFAKLWQYDSFRDIHLTYHLLKEGKGYYMREVLGVYIQHAGGIFSQTTDQQKLLIHYKLYKELNKKNKDEIIRKKFLSLIFRYLIWKNQNLETNNGIDSNKIFSDSIKTVRTSEELKTLLKLSVSPKFKTRVKEIFKPLKRD